MKLHVFSYRYALEILQHPNNLSAWTEIESVLSDAPVFTYPGKSKRNSRLEIVQQLMNTYFDRRFAIDCGWNYHPFATGIMDSKLAADFRKNFVRITIQAEVQFGNMARWYSDIFKLQAAYSQSLIHAGLCVVPMHNMATRIDSNIAYYERAVRELPAAELSITLPILLVGLEQDDKTPVDVRPCQFASPQEITGKGSKQYNRWRIVNGYIKGVAMASIGPNSDPNPMIDTSIEDDEEE